MTLHTHAWPHAQPSADTSPGFHPHVHPPACACLFVFGRGRGALNHLNPHLHSDNSRWDPFPYSQHSREKEGKRFSSFIEMQTNSQTYQLHKSKCTFKRRYKMKSRPINSGLIDTRLLCHFEFYGTSLTLSMSIVINPLTQSPTSNHCLSQLFYARHPND